MDLSIALAGARFAEAVPVMKRICAIMEGQGANLEFLILTDTAAREDGWDDTEIPCAVRAVPRARGGFGAQIHVTRQYAQGDWLIWLDRPVMEDASLVFGFWSRRHEGALLIASRYAPGGSHYMSRARTALSRALNSLYRRGLDVHVRDLSSMRRMYRLSVLRQIPIQGGGYEALMEILLRVMSLGEDVVEIPWHYGAEVHWDSPAQWPRMASQCLRTFLRMHALRNSVDYPDYDYRAYDSRIWLQRYWQRKRYRIVQEFAGISPRMLDIGCGSSRIIAHRPEMIALDVNPCRLRFLKRSNPRRLQATAGRLPFPDNVFDAVISSQVIEHTAEDSCVAEAVRVLRPAGVLVIGTPDYATFWWPITEKVYGFVKRGGYADEHINHYTYASLVEALEGEGCSVEAHRYIGGGELIIKARKNGRPPADVQA